MEVLLILFVIIYFAIVSNLLSGISTIALEALVYDIHSIRFIPIGLFPQFDNDERIPLFHDSEDFITWFKSYCNTIPVFDSNQQLVNEYFYKSDRNANLRLWEFIRDLYNKNFIHNKLKS